MLNVKHYILKTFIFWMVLLIHGCKSDCEFDTLAKEKFLEKIDLVEKGHLEDFGVPVSSQVAIIFLEEITEVNSSVEWGDVPAYESRVKLEEDIRLWHKWLNDNYCYISIEEIENLERRVDSLFYY